MRMHTRLSVAAAVAFASLVSGCASTPKSSGADTEAFASRLIADRVEIASNAQREYVAWLSGQQGTVTLRYDALAIDSIDVDFIGRPDDLLRAFARRYGLRFVALGHREYARVVNVRMTRTTPLDVIRNVREQIAPDADVVLDDAAKALRLVYRG